MNEKTLRTLEYYQILNILKKYAMSIPAKNKISQLLPSNDIEYIEKELSKVDEAHVYIQKYGDSPNIEFDDIDVILKKVKINATLNSHEIISIGKVLRCAKNLLKFFSNVNVYDYPYLNSYKKDIYNFEKIIKTIDNTFISENEISDNASENLAKIRQNIRRLQIKIKDLLEQYIRSSKNQKYLQESIITVRGDRFVLPIKAEYKNEVQGIVHDQSATGATLFIEPLFSVELNNQIRILLSEERDEIERILKKISEEINENYEQIMLTYRTLIEIDFIFAKARYALSLRATKPILNDNNYIQLKKARHPLIPYEKVVANDIELGLSFRVLLITGPNTGGKTVTLKTVGLINLMAQSGLFVPCSENSNITVFDNIFADIGDEQSIAQSLSTFSSHMKNIIEIISNINQKSLVLIDEIGAGTDPEEGAALGKAILEYIYEKGALAVATTHYGELKIFAQEKEGFENASCEFDIATLSPTYRLLIGVPGVSNALYISSNLGLPKEIVNKAKNYLSDYKINLEKIIADMEAKRQVAEKRATEIESLREELHRQKALFEEERKKFEIEKERIKQKAKKEAKDYVDKFSYEIESLLKDLRKKAEALKEKEILKELDDKKRHFIQISNSTATNSYDEENKYFSPIDKVKIGQEVYVKNLGSIGFVDSLPDEKGNLTVRVGILKINVNIRDLAKNEETYVDKQQNYKKTIEINVQKVPLSLDVRGLLADDAIMEVDKYLDNAYVAGLKEITIIHGKGTGTLRNVIRKFLKNHQLVKSMREGNYNEGDQGVTIVSLRD